MSGGMIYAYFEPTLLDFIKQSLQQECRVQVPPNITDRWSAEFEHFRTSLVNYVIFAHPHDYWERLLRDNNFSEEESPNSRDFILSYLKAMVAEYTKFLWLDCLAALGCSRLRKTVEELKADVEHESTQALQSLREGRHLLPYTDWSNYRAFANYNPERLAHDLRQIK